ncbi:hypothetical protein MKZ38_004740 [Zalerion maritima]|uniref:Pyridoxamine 5'-phosphate oxidase putative domain-containing protein n=1 Tax=Zalerion maritima TaxID=339359 RepID=A0AAD5RXR2_9PEZI|nr:hypothetical protein MKZ38_004740 [Zalerion maritima]
MTSKPASKKSENLAANPNVSLLVHDWVSHRPPTTSRRPSGGSPGPENRSSLATLLLNLNTSSISSISATINGTAQIISGGTEEEAFFREKHLENNTFEDSATRGGARFSGQEGGRETEAGRCFVEGEEVRVIVVKIEDVRTSDWKGVVSDFSIVGGEGGINGVR